MRRFVCPPPGESASKLLLILAALAGTVLAGTVLADTVLAAPPPIEVRDFDLRKGAEERAVFTIERQGTIRVRVHVREPLPSAPVKVLLLGPDGVEVEKKGSAPLRLHYSVVDQTQVGSWQAVVVNHGKMARLVGELEVRFEPETPGETPAAKAVEPAVPKPKAPPPAEKAAEPAAPKPKTKPKTKTKKEPPKTAAITDGKVLTAENRDKIRAVCRDKNQDVFVRLDLASGTGAFFLRYNPVFTLEARPRGDTVIELRGSGDTPLYLDLENKVLYFEGDGGGLFCRVRIYYGEG